VPRRYDDEIYLVGHDTVAGLTRVVSAIQSTVGCASDIVGAQSGVPCIAGVAVGEAGSGVKPTPVRVEDDC
jgi:hypothetical protein